MEQRPGSHPMAGVFLPTLLRSSTMWLLKEEALLDGEASIGLESWVGNLYMYIVKLSKVELGKINKVVYRLKTQYNLTLYNSTTYYPTTTVTCSLQPVLSF